MRLLLDTHTVLWWLSNDRRLSAAARNAISSPVNQLFVSAAVGYEIVYKQKLGRLPPTPGNLRDSLRREGMGLLPISLDHAIHAAQLPGPHRNPWDRIMMAQAIAEQCHMVTIDPMFAQYGVSVIW